MYLRVLESDVTNFRLTSYKQLEGKMRYHLLINHTAL